MSELSHRQQHRQAAAAVGTGPDSTSTGDDYRAVRRQVAQARRAEQDLVRRELGTSRAVLRAERARAGLPVRARLWWPWGGPARALRLGARR